MFNLYPVANQDDLRFSYRYVEVDGELGASSGDPDLAVKNLNLLAKKVALGQELAVAIIRGGKKPLLAIAAGHPIEGCEYQLTPHVVSLRPQDEIHSVTFSNLDEITRQIALSFLGWELRGHLYKRKDLWRRSPNTFFRKRPVNVDGPRRGFDLYGGFSPRFLFVEGLLHIAVPVVYCYTDSQWADNAFDNRAIQRLAGRRMLYHFGPQLYPVKFQKRTGKTLRMQHFCPEGTNTTANVYDWTVEKVGQAPAGRQLDPDSPAIQYRNVGNEEERYGALSLCKLMLSNDDPRVARSRREYQRNPKQRIESANGIVKTFLADLSLSGVTLKFDTVPRHAPAKHFDYPEIRFGNGRVMRVSRTPTSGSVLLIHRYFLDATRKGKQQGLPKTSLEIIRDNYALWTGSWHVEFACDMVATYWCGPAYGWANLRLSATRGDPYQDSTTHPADDARREGIASISRLAGDGSAANEIDLLWKDLRRLSPSTQPPGYAKRYSTRLLEKLAECIFNTCTNAGFHRFADQQNQQHAFVSRTVADAWREFHQDAAAFPKIEASAIDGLQQRFLTV